MAVLRITSREFRDKQKSFLDLADKGEQIIIRRGKKKAYTITPVNDMDPFFTPEMLAKIDKSVEEAKDGKLKTFATKKELHTYLDSL